MYRLSGFLAAILGLCFASGCSSDESQSLLLNGIGTTAHTADTRVRALSAGQYIGLMCTRAGVPTVTSSDGAAYCNPRPGDRKAWLGIVRASFNDIDERCDLYLESLNRARRDRKTLIDQIRQTSTTTTALLAIDALGPGAGSAAISIVALAFGYLESSVDTYYSRLILQFENRVVQGVVKKRQTVYRTELENKYMQYVIHQPSAYYAIRGYLRLCLPTTIESEIRALLADVKYEKDGKRKLEKGDFDPDLERLKTFPGSDPDRN